MLISRVAALQDNSAWGLVRSCRASIVCLFSARGQVGHTKNPGGLDIKGR